MADSPGPSNFANPVRPRWYRSSFVFVLLGLQLLAASMVWRALFWPAAAALLLAAVNLKNDDWYKHRWPWFIVALLAATLLMSLLALRIANANPDPAIPTEQGSAAVFFPRPACGERVG